MRSNSNDDITILFCISDVTTGLEHCAFEECAGESRHQNRNLIPTTLVAFSGANAKLRYQITAGNAGGAFDVKPETGVIFIAQPLDYEELQLYELHLLASDGKWEDYAIVIVNIVNKNDEAPVFALNEYYGSVIEELDGLPVFVLQVHCVGNIS